MQYVQLTKMYESRTRSMQVKMLAENIEQFTQENGYFVADLASLAGMGPVASPPGFEHTRSLFQPWQAYEIGPLLDDGIWRYQRMVLFATNPEKGVTKANYLARNACGVGTFHVAQSWCGSKDSRWFRRETKELYHDQIVTQRVRMHRMLQKLSYYYNQESQFPNKDQSNVDLPDASIRKLADLVGYSGGAKQCTGTFHYMGVPVDCGDMFDLWGNHIGYQYESKKHIILVAETPLVNSSGKKLIVAAEYDLTLL